LHNKRTEAAQQIFMIEPIMYIGIGFLVAGLLVIGVIPLVHARAVRLTLRRLEALTPISRAEIQADKDQLRAEFAMLVTRLELNIERLKAKTVNQAAEIGRKSEAIGRLKFELSEKTAALLALEAKENRSAHNVPPFESELTALRAQAELLRDHVGGYDKENKELRDRLRGKTAEAEAVRQQLAEERARADRLGDRVGELERTLSAQTADVI
jgi:chromosome segregation ATPase